MIRQGLHDSPVHEVLVEESVLGWKEYELEVMRDHHDNCVVICSIENIDAMGVHTGDSITVAPAMTLSDPEYQRMRDASFAVLRRIGVETGGSNVQFAVDPVTGRQVVIEMNPRVSRSSALASKATGFPIAKIAARAGHRLLAGRDRQRHHPRDQGGLRAVHRLRRHQDPALRVREVPRHRRHADHPHEVRRRDHVDRPHLPRVLQQGAALARGRPHRVRRVRPAGDRGRRARGRAGPPDRPPPRRRRRGAHPRAGASTGSAS